MKNPVISCIVPVYNGESYLSETLDSILEQTYRPLELIVVDDGSTDTTADIVRTYSKDVHYVWQPNSGETAARNRGLTLVNGDFVAFLDADDLWHPQKLARQMEIFESKPDLDLCFTQFQNFWSPELAENEKLYLESSLSQPFSGYCIATLLAKSDVFVRFGNFTDDGSRIPQNTIWFLHAEERNARIHVIPEILMRRRLHSNSMSQQHGLNMYFHILKEWRDYQRRRTAK